MVRLSTKTYADIPEDIREKAKHRVIDFATKKRIAVYRFKHQLSMLGHVWKKMDDKNKEILRQIYDADNITIIETKTGIALDKQEQTNHLKTVAKVIEVTDDVVSSVASTAKDVAVSTVTNTISAIDRVRTVAHWIKNRSIGLKMFMFYLSSHAFLKLAEGYHGQELSESLTAIMKMTTIVSTFTVSTGMFVLCAASIWNKYLEYVDYWNQRKAIEQQQKQPQQQTDTVLELQKMHNEMQIKMMEMIQKAREEASHVTDERFRLMLQQQQNQQFMHAMEENKDVLIQQLRKEIQEARQQQTKEKESEEPEPEPETPTQTGETREQFLERMAQIVESGKKFSPPNI